MFRYSRNAIKLANNSKKFNGSLSLSSTRALSISLVNSSNSNNSNNSNSSYGSISLLASVFIGAVVAVTTHKVILINTNANTSLFLHYYIQ